MKTKNSIPFSLGLALAFILASSFALSAASRTKAEALSFDDRVSISLGGRSKRVYWQHRILANKRAA